jgi:maltooligosyltrehalose trehalohydrolase
MTAARPPLGATPVPGGTRFEVWAPEASQIDVRIEGRNVTAALRPDGTTGNWIGMLEGITAGDRYRLRVDGGSWLPDPASRFQPDGVHGPSEIVDRSYEWRVDGWRGIDLDRAVVYELHVGTFTPQGTLRAAIDQLDRLAELGVTLVELMPVNAFPGERNWGYDGVFPYAVQASYGGPAALAEFVDAAHGRGLGVLLDVVYNHLGPEGNVLARFGPYFTDAHTTPWGAAVNVSERRSDDVRRYLVDNALGWIRDYRLDGLRLDAVHAIVDPTAVTFVEELTAAVHALAAEEERDVLVTLESSANDPRLVRAVDQHGWGADAVWNDDVHHALRVALTGERHEYYAGYTGVVDLAAAWQHRFVYRGQFSPTHGRRHGAPVDDVDHRHFVVFTTNHDHVGNTARGERMLSDDPDRWAKLRLAASAILLSPFTPMLFMGEEYGEVAPFPYFVDHTDPELVEAVRRGRTEEFAHLGGSDGIADPADPSTFRAAVLDPSLAESEPHRSHLAMYTELLRLRRELDIVTHRDADQSVTLQGEAMTVTRTLGDEQMILVLNFGDRAFTREPAGRTVFDSNSRRWGGGGDTEVAPWSARLAISGD